MPAKPIVPWMGGKRRLAKHILPLFPQHTCYVEPFCGGAALFFSKPLSKAEVINDLNSELVNLYRVVQHHLDEFVRQFRWALTSREMYQWHQATPPKTLTDIQRAARFFYLQKSSFGGKVVGQSFGTSTTSPPKLNLLRIEEELSQAHLRLARVTIEREDWAACMARYDRPHTLFYLDPPYWQTEGYGPDFPFEEYQRMAVVMDSLQGQAVLSINDHPDIREVFGGFTLRPVDVGYTISGGGKVPAKELIITNF